jgi:hypothetical protein
MLMDYKNNQYTDILEAISGVFASVESDKLKYNGYCKVKVGNVVEGGVFVSEDFLTDDEIANVQDSEDKIFIFYNKYTGANIRCQSVSELQNSIESAFDNYKRSCECYFLTSGLVRFMISDNQDAALESAEFQAANENRKLRDSKISETDWTRLDDVDEALKTKFGEYRQALRDITDHTNWPFLESEDWPTKPE